MDLFYRNSDNDIINIELIETDTLLELANKCLINCYKSIVLNDIVYHDLSISISDITLENDSIINITGYCKDNCICGNDSLYYAIENNHLECVKNMHNNNILPRNSKTMYIALDGGDLSIIKYLHENRYTWLRGNNYDNNIHTRILTSFNLELIKFADSINIGWFNNIATYDHKYDYFNKIKFEILDSCDFDLIKYINDNVYYLNDIECINYLRQWYYNNNNIIEYLESSPRDIPNRYTDSIEYTNLHRPQWNLSDGVEYYEYESDEYHEDGEYNSRESSSVCYGPIAGCDCHDCYDYRY